MGSVGLKLVHCFRYCMGTNGLKCSSMSEVLYGVKDFELIRLA